MNNGEYKGAYPMHPPSPSIIRIDCFLIIDLTAKSSTNPPPPPCPSYIHRHWRRNRGGGGHLSPASPFYCKDRHNVGFQNGVKIFFQVKLPPSRLVLICVLRLCTGTIKSVQVYVICMFADVKRSLVLGKCVLLH